MAALSQRGGGLVQSVSVKARERHRGKVKVGSNDECGDPHACADEQRDHRFNTPPRTSELAEGKPLAPPSAHAAAPALVSRCTPTPCACDKSRHSRTSPSPDEPTPAVLEPIVEATLAPGPAFVVAPVPERVLAPGLVRVRAAIRGPA